MLFGLLNYFTLSNILVSGFCNSFPEHTLQTGDCHGSNDNVKNSIEFKLVIVKLLLFKVPLNIFTKLSPSPPVNILYFPDLMIFLRNFLPI